MLWMLVPTALAAAGAGQEGLATWGFASTQAAGGWLLLLYVPWMMRFRQS